MILALLLLPALSGIVALLLRADALRRQLLFVTAVLHSGLTIGAWFVPPQPLFDSWLMLDSLGFLFLNIVSGLFLAVSIYAVGYLRIVNRRHQPDLEEKGTGSINAPEAIFTACLLFLLAAMTLAVCSQHLGLFWVAMESATLAVSPLLYFHRHHRSLEATWKYLLIGSIGISIALLGTFFLAVSASFHSGQALPLVLGDLLTHAPTLNTPWLKAAFIFLLVGYGTKMGLAPMHTWKPDAYSEAPAVVAALLSGALTNCAFLGILRAQQICAAAGQAEFGQESLIAFGLLSMAVAGVFIIGQADYKRMLAYSSVEHMGILVLGVGLGGGAVFGALLHALNNALAKPMLFMTAGNIRRAYRTKSAEKVTGVLSVLPFTGVLWIVGLLATTGFPPFGLFVSELTILKGAFDQGQGLTGILFFVLLAPAFIGVATIILRMAHGRPSADLPTLVPPNSKLMQLSPALLCAGLLLLGLYIPPFLRELLYQAASTLGAP